MKVFESFNFVSALKRSLLDWCNRHQASSNAAHSWRRFLQRKVFEVLWLFPLGLVSLNHEKGCGACVSHSEHHVCRVSAGTAGGRSAGSHALQNPCIGPSCRPQVATGAARRRKRSKQLSKLQTVSAKSLSHLTAVSANIFSIMRHEIKQTPLSYSEKIGVVSVCLKFFKAASCSQPQFSELDIISWLLCRYCCCI